ncbi:uncharacterized protein LOC114521703 [Dendronephthya gigantea]|uniref:uncharacterized protein LOC114521703 n=1 Tax=Dendronephthya gigantea TaxID=151771 RepID=UPI00106B55F5|nr:uncharacterized protein LOC114521703 [Dendronephthya gigantea]
MMRSTHYQVLLFLCVGESLAFTEKCSLPLDVYSSGPKESVVLSLYHCFRPAYSETKKFVDECKSQPSSKMVLKRYQVVDMKDTVNGYAVTAKFYGDQVCVAYRKKQDIHDSRGHITPEYCTTKCQIKDEASAIYKTELVCNGTAGCTGGYKRLKFIVSDSSSETTMISLTVLTICTLLSAAFAS